MTTDVFRSTTPYSISVRSVTCTLGRNVRSSHVRLVCNRLSRVSATCCDCFVLCMLAACLRLYTKYLIYMPSIYRVRPYSMDLEVCALHVVWVTHSYSRSSRRLDFQAISTSASSPQHEIRRDHETTVSGSIPRQKRCDLARLEARGRARRARHVGSDAARLLQRGGGGG